MLALVGRTPTKGDCAQSPAAPLCALFSFPPSLGTENAGGGGRRSPPADNGIDTQRRSELENLLSPLTAELGERLEVMKRVHSRHTKLKRDRDSLFARLKAMEDVALANPDLPGSREVLAILHDSSSVQHLL